MSLESIKRRINSIESTSKITNAMKLIASSKLAKQTKKFNKQKEYFNEYYNAIANLLSMVNETDLEILKSTNNKTLWIVVTSNLGLCAGYNINLYKEITNKIKPNDYLAVFGKRGNEYFAKKFPNATFIDTSIINVDADISSEMCDFIANEIYQKFIGGEFSNIKIAYTKFVNAITFKPNVVDVFPFDEKLKNNNIEINENMYDFEPNKKALLLSIIPQYIAMVISASLCESILSECASRRNAMDTATTNATDLITKYKLQYNRIRQTNITNEIIEIVAGNEKGE